MKRVQLMLFASTIATSAVATPAFAQSVDGSATKPAASAAGEHSASGSGGGGSGRDVRKRMSKHRRHRM